MSRLQSIENKLSSINEAAFQNLCDSFLALRNNNYSALSRIGSQSGKQKTIKGTPDTFLLLPNGKYIFVEYSTNISAGLRKLEEDVRKCIDTNKTGIQVNQIAEIILCVNYNLTALEIQALKSLLTHTRIGLTVYTLDSLSLELHLHHRDLTHEYLGLPLDTGQIVSISKFIEEYNKASKGISTPLDNTFLHREQELKELNDTILHNDFIILTGAPGIGKTKLALEGINNFLAENLSFGSYCISYKNHTLLDDLYQYFDTEKDYILLVDDANRIDAFSQITGFYRSTRHGKLKIVITVREYAFQDIGILCQEFSPKRIDLAKFSDEQIIDIIKAYPFEILNSDYHKEIVRIADGNPRLAIMTALLAKAHQDIYALADVSDLFENYFSTFIKDDGEFAKALNIQCLGLIAFFYTIPYKNKEITTSILDNFGIDYPSFIDAIDKLDKLELVEIQFEHVKIPEQNLSTYFFYKAFIKDNLLSFETLLSKYFESNTIRFKDCVIPANNTFGANNVMDKLQPFLQNYWKEIKFEESIAFKFLSSFWYYLQIETLEYVLNIIESIQTVSVLRYEVSSDNNFSYSKNEVLELLEEFLRFPTHLKDVLELGFEYTKKKPEHLPEWIKKIEEGLNFDREDQTQFGFVRQTILYQILLDGLQNGDLLLTTVFYKLSQTFLSFSFRHTKGGRNNSIYFYDYTIPNILPIQNFRQKIWDAINRNFSKYPVDSFNLLTQYTKGTSDIEKGIVEFDISFLIGIIQKNFSLDSFEHCKYVQDLIRWCKRNSVENHSFEELCIKFTNPIYEIYLKIDWDRYRDKEIFDFVDYRDYEKLKEVEIRSSFVFENYDEIRNFYGIFNYLKKVIKNDWNYNTTLDIVVDENFSNNFDLGILFLQAIIKSNNEVNYVPRNVFRNQLINNYKSQKIWELIKLNAFNGKEFWELSFYDNLDDSLLSEEHVKALVNTISHMNEPSTIHFDRLRRFLKLEPNLFQIILKIIVDKNNKESTRIRVWVDFFSSYFDQLGDDIELIKNAYLQQYEIYQYFDFDGKGFLNILKKDRNFLLEFVNSLYSKKLFGLSGEQKNLGFVWEIADIEITLIQVFDLIILKDRYLGILEHFCNSFFKNLHESHKFRAKNFIIAYCTTNFNNVDKMNVIVDVVRHSFREIFNEILLLFLSLCQDREIFSKIYWKGNGGTYSGNVIIGDIEASEWMEILSVVEKSPIGIKLIPIKKYLNERIDGALRSGDWERQRRFLDRY